MRSSRFKGAGFREIASSVCLSERLPPPHSLRGAKSTIGGITIAPAFSLPTLALARDVMCGVQGSVCKRRSTGSVCLVCIGQHDGLSLWRNVGASFTSLGSGMGCQSVTHFQHVWRMTRAPMTRLHMGTDRPWSLPSTENGDEDGEDVSLPPFPRRSFSDDESSDTNSENAWNGVGEELFSSSSKTPPKDGDIVYIGGTRFQRRGRALVNMDVGDSELRRCAGLPCLHCTTYRTRAGSSCASLLIKGFGITSDAMDMARVVTILGQSRESTSC
jgi:hypothetical protein